MLASFDALWTSLTVPERRRVFELLIERVTYDADTEEIAITFRPGGVRILANDEERQSA